MLRVLSVPNRYLSLRSARCAESHWASRLLPSGPGWKALEAPLGCLRARSHPLHLQALASEQILEKVRRKALRHSASGVRTASTLFPLFHRERRRGSLRAFKAQNRSVADLF